MTVRDCLRFIFFFNDTATTEIYTLSLHDALPISAVLAGEQHVLELVAQAVHEGGADALEVARRQEEAEVGQLAEDRKSTRLNSSHANISYAVFCLKKKINHVLLLHLLTNWFRLLY